MLKNFRKIKYFIRISFQNCSYFIYDIITIIFSYRKVKCLSENFNNQKSIGIISDVLLPRINKIVFGLTSAGYDILLITKNPQKNNKLFKLVITYKSPFKALWIAKQFKPLVYHLFSSWDFNTSHKIILNKINLPPVIFDDYDVLAGMINENFLKEKYPGQLEKEKFCLENANGLCCRSLETQFAKKNLKYRFQGKRIFFPEYIWNYSETKGRKEIKKKTLVYIGNYNNSIVSFASLLKNIDWNLDIYPFHSSSKIYINTKSNVKILKTLEPKELIPVLELYEVAIQFPGSVLTQGKNIYTGYKLSFAASGKIFDYLEAGLKVLISDELMQKWILKRYGAAIEFDDINPLDDIIKKLSNFDAGKNKGENSNNKLFNLTIEKQILRLVKFYHDIS